MLVRIETRYNYYNRGHTKHIQYNKLVTETGFKSCKANMPRSSLNKPLPSLKASLSNLNQSINDSDSLDSRFASIS